MTTVHGKINRAQSVADLWNCADENIGLLPLHFQGQTCGDEEDFLRYRGNALM